LMCESHARISAARLRAGKKLPALIIGGANERRLLISREGGFREEIVRVEVRF